MRRRMGRLGTVVTALTVALTVGTVPTAHAEDQPAPVKVLIIGDSVTNGYSGDWTWRYRLWQHLQAAGAAVDLVGPRESVQDPDNVFLQNLDYVDPDFDRDHAARGGMRFEMPDAPVGQLVETYQPDVVVELLGVNDLFFSSGDDPVTPERLVNRARAFVAEARAADPGIGLVLGHVPQALGDPYDEYNDLLDEAAPDLDTEESPVEVASFGEGLVIPDLTFDLLHPNARGEVLIAAGVADALARLGVGSAYPRPLPDVPIGPRLMPTLTAAAGDEQVTLTWSDWRGADRQLVWQRDVTVGEAWREVEPKVPNPSLVVGDLQNGHTYEFRLRPVRGYHAAEGLFSNVVQVTPRPPPVTASPAATADRLGRAAVSWPDVPGSTGYLVEARRTGSTAVARSTTTSGPSAVLTGLAAGRSYDVVVLALRDDAASDPSPGAAVTMPVPRAVWVTSRTSPAVDRVRVGWGALPEAMSYEVQVRPVARCGAVPAGGWARAAVTRHTSLTFRSAARTAWVRVLAIRDGVRGPVGVHSARCGRVS